MTISKRTNPIDKLRKKMPVANQQVASGLEAARNIGMQQAVRQAPTQQPIQQQQQAIGAQVQQQAGAQQLQQAQQTARIEQQIAQQQLQEQQRQAQKSQFEANVRNRQRKMDTEKVLAAFGQDVKDQILDNRLSFAKDEYGRTLMNDRQMLDFAMLQTQNQEQWLDYKQQREHAYQRKLQTMDTAHKRIMQQLEHEFSKSEQDKDQALQKRLLVAKQKVEEKIRAEQARAANEAAMWQAGGTIVGAVGGAAIGNMLLPGLGGAAGASAGAAIGGGLGSMTGGLLD